MVGWYRSHTNTKGIAKAAQTVRNVEWFEVTQVRGQVVDG